MTYTLAIGDRTYSSWSLRGWLLFARFGLEVDLRHAHIRTPQFSKMLADFGAAQTVPVMRSGDVVVSDSLAILETLAEAHPQAGHWPRDPVARGLARSLVAEMHSGFSTLRSRCPMNLGTAYTGLEVDAPLRGDLDRLEQLWALAFDRRDALGAEGPWLFGDYTAADAFFAPVAARIAGYDLPVGAQAAAYVTTHLADPDFRRWRAMGLASGHVQTQYAQDLPQVAWPGPVALPAEAVASGTPKNAVCPYSGEPVVAEALARIDGQIVGFCNPFCRDKSVADAAAWPALMAVLAG